ncbi:MAG TPA: sigma-70 family RNA polymerase sigma factor [Bryobacteraceae bacterium]|jgi:RNA polymerase sigma-70 factor (ECF subfamily)
MNNVASEQCEPSLSHPKELSDETLLFLLRATSDAQLADRLFAEIFERYHARVVNWCYAVARDREAATDLAQEVFLKIFRSLHAFRGDSRMSTWIYVITRNHCLNSLRKRDNEPTGSPAPIPLHLEGENGLETHSKLEDAETFQNIYRVISSILTPMEVRVLCLHYAHDLTLASITRHLRLTNRSGAKAFIVSAKRKLKLYLLNRGITPENLKAGDETWAARAVDYRAWAA